MTTAARTSNGIGELNEGPLHAALKATYAANGGATEVTVDNFVADAVRNGIVYEIQTGSFSGLGRKLLSLLDHSGVREVVLVHPIAQTSTIVKVPDQAGAKIQRRKSPKHGRLMDIVSELVYIPTLLNRDNFSVEVVLTVEEEIRTYDPRKNRRRGGWRVRERRLLEIVDGMRLSSMEDLWQLLPGALQEPFSTRDLADVLQAPLATAQQMAYCLRHAGVTEITGKQGNSLLYRSRR